MDEQIFDKIQQLINEVEKVVFGKREIIQMTVAALLAGGHVLFEDIPGVGKTQLVKALAKAVESDYARIQFTPDLLPNDILGVSIFNSETHQFEFRKGAIFTSILLADEINRTTPRTQAALLEAMSEGHVTIDNQTYPLSPHFFVLATQNPIEYEGTFPLPEAQLDRFLFRLHIGYPDYENELQLLLGEKQQSVEDIRPILSDRALSQLKETVKQVYIDEQVARYALDLVRNSRRHNAVELGISPRGAIAFIQGAKAFALTQSRMFVTPADLQKIMPAVFGHRLLLKGGLAASSEKNAEVMEQILQQTAVPVRR
ncbi:AAA family ATPase [Enterococcus sp. HY326]|uniref:AAA family ATPase n=1 Tax=Enterococcus sp. HY326 TaxID=2971265 RepID=UPI00223FA0D9|nr:MoxR family ATPase [Enterococcus sp. HY326]